MTSSTPITPTAPAPAQRSLAARPRSIGANRSTTAHRAAAGAPAPRAPAAPRRAPRTPAAASAPVNAAHASASRVAEFCRRHPDVDPRDVLASMTRAEAARAGRPPRPAQAPATSSRRSTPARMAPPIGKPTGDDLRGWDIREAPPETPYPLSEQDYQACGRDFSPEAQARRGLVRGVRSRQASADRDRRIVGMRRQGWTQRAIAAAVGLSRGAVRHALDRHDALMGKRDTAGQRRQAAAQENRRQHRTAWQIWCNVAPTGRGPAVRRAWAASHVAIRMGPRKRRGGYAQRLPPTASRADQTANTARYAHEHDRNWRGGPAQSVSDANLPDVLSGGWTQHPPSLTPTAPHVVRHGRPPGRRAVRLSSPLRHAPQSSAGKPTPDRPGPGGRVSTLRTATRRPRPGTDRRSALQTSDPQGPGRSSLGSSPPGAQPAGSPPWSERPRGCARGGRAPRTTARRTRRRGVGAW